MKRILLVLLICGFGSNIHAQKFFEKKLAISNYTSISEEDKQTLKSYSLDFESSKNDTTRMSVLLECSKNMSDVKSKKALNRLLFLSAEKSLKSEKRKEVILRLKYFKVDALAEDGLVFLDDGKFLESIDRYSKAIELASEIGDTNGLVSMYSNLAYISQFQEDYEGSIKLYEKTIDIAKKSNDPDGVGGAYLNMGTVYYALNEIDEAIDVTRKSIDLLEPLGSSYELQSAYDNLGMILLLKREEIDSASVCFDKSIQIAEDLDDPWVTYIAEGSKLSLLLAKGDYIKAEKQAEKLLELSRGLNEQMEIVGSLAELYEIKIERGKFKEALEIRNEEFALQKELWKKEDVAALSDLEAKLKYENEIKLNKVKAKNAENNAYEKTVIIYGVIGVLFLIIGLLVLLLMNRSKLRKRKKHLEELDTVNKQIFSIISHDFKEPIISFNLLLKDLEKDEKLDQSSLNEMKSQIKSSSDVLSNLLNWAKSELDRQEIRKEKFGLKEMLDRIIGSLEVNAKKKSLIVTNEISDDELMIGDVAMLEIVFRNILSNAIKYSPEGGQVTIRKEGESIQISDEGSGVSETVQSSLFKEKVIPSYGTAGESGFGIGLFIVANLLKKNGKVISFSGNAPKGTIFNIQDAAN